jgi:hypothetical protein
MRRAIPFWQGLRLTGPDLGRIVDSRNTHTRISQAWNMPFQPREQRFRVFVECKQEIRAQHGIIRDLHERLFEFLETSAPRRASHELLETIQDNDERDVERILPFSEIRNERAGARRRYGRTRCTGRLPDSRVQRRQRRMIPLVEQHRDLGLGASPTLAEQRHHRGLQQSALVGARLRNEQRHARETHHVDEKVKLLSQELGT